MELKLKYLVLFFAFALLSAMGQSQPPATDCQYKKGVRDYLSRIDCPTDYNYLKGKSLTEKFGQVASVKIVYHIRTDKVYFINSTLYPFHYDFCSNVLHNPDELSLFNLKNYRTNPSRDYMLVNLNYYSWLDLYGLELMPEDDTETKELNSLFKKISALVYFGNKVRVLAMSPEMEKRFASIPSMPIIRSNDVYKGRQFVSLNKGKAYGYLKKVTVDEIGRTAISKHDIVILDGLPNQLPVVAGVLTVPFQTPLCHISLLCQNRKTPNATYRTAWSDPAIASLLNKLVCYEVTADSFTIRKASEVEAGAWWLKTESRKAIKLPIDTSIKKITGLQEMSFKNVPSIGGKAANFSELLKIRVDKKPIPLPEGSFAIPFYFYYQHLRENNIKKLVDSILANTSLLDDPQRLNSSLKKLRDAIKAAPVNKGLLEAISARIKMNGQGFENYRFRSSTNAEDVKGFNGAGLYESKTGSLTDPDKQIEKAIKTVWASLWDERAFAERQYFKIDQHSVAMGILVHRAFGEELSNGVAVTKHLYRKNYPAYTFNAQVGEISVVTPPDSVSCDEGIIGLGRATGSHKISVEYIGRSNLSKDKTVLTYAQVELLAKYLTAIKEHFYYKVDKSAGRDEIGLMNFGMDVEFKIDAFTGKLYIKQARSL
jgi:pyruvate, water dikinase